MLALWTVCTAPGAAAGKDTAKSNGPANGTTAAALVWPGPPLRARVRFIAAISSTEDVTGKPKLSLAERLAGRSAARGRRALQKPYGVAVDRSGRVYVADPAQRAVLVFDRNARTIGSWRGNAQFPLFLPTGLAFAPDGRLFVADSYGAQIVVFDTSGKPVAGFGRDTLQRPGGLAVDGRGERLYVADTKANRVAVFDARGYQAQQPIGGPSRSGEFEPGTFSGPTNLALDSKGRLYVSDTWNCRIQVFEPGGRFLRTFGTQGTRPGHFARPKGIAIDSEDHVYVVDSEFHNFQILTAEGKPLMFVGSPGDEAGQFLLPAGLAIDREDRIYVTEQRVSGGRLQIFQYLGERPGGH